MAKQKNRCFLKRNNVSALLLADCGLRRGRMRLDYIFSDADLNLKIKEIVKMKKIISIIMATVMVFAFAGCGKNDLNKTDKALIGVLQYGEHASLDNCRIGFIEGLKEAGLVEGKDFEIDYQNAGFDDSKTTQIAQNFSAKDASLMCAIATPAAISCYAAAEDKNIPVIFTAITDPESANLDKGNITGTSDKLPVTAQLELIRKLQPNAKTIGIIYTSSEPNSVSAIREYEENASSYGFTIESIAVTQQSQVAQAADTLISKKVDCMSNLTDNNVVGVLASILEKTNEANIPVYGSEIEQVKLGCVASAGLDYIELGKTTGKMAAEILQGKKAADMDYETVSDYKTYINSPQLSAMNIQIEPSFAQQCVEVAEK